MEEKNSKLSMPVVAIIAVVATALVAVAVFMLVVKPPSQSQGQQDTPAQTDTTYTVPNVLSLTRSDAEKAILASGLQVGDVTQQPSDTIPLGSVISQDPEALTNAKANSKVNLVISSGKADKKDVQVPDLKGQTQADAKDNLKKAGLVAIIGEPEETTEVEPGLVYKQSIAAGTTVKEGTKVTLVTAVAPTQSTVPDVVGMSRDDAKATLDKADLGFDTTTAYDDKVELDKVISQSVKAGSKVKAGTTVTLCISLGPKPAEQVTVPDVVGNTWSDAEATMHSAGLAVRYTGDPAGKVVSQDVAAGTKVDKNTLVTLTLSTPTEQVEVPNLIGMSVTSAENATDAVNLALEASTTHGTVIDQWPAAGTMVDPRTSVQVKVDDSDFREPTAEDYIGTWGSGRATISIQNVGEGLTATVTWANSASEYTEWTYPCNLVDGKLVCNGKGTKVNVTTSESGDETRETEYTDGSATLSVRHGQLTWDDQVEDAGNGMVFTRS